MPWRMGAGAVRPFGRRDQQRLQLQVGHQVVEEEVALVEAIQAVEQRSDRALGLPEDPQEHGHVAQGDETGDRAQDDPGVAAVVGQVGQQAPAQPRHRAPLGNGAVLQVEAGEQLLVALEKRLAQPEELDLLDALVAGQQRLQVVQQAGFRRAAADGAKRTLGVLGLREKRGDGGHEDDDREPRAEPHQQDDQGDQRDDLLHHLQRRVDDVERAGVRLAPRVLQGIVEDRDLRRSAGPG